MRHVYSGLDRDGWLTSAEFTDVMKRETEKNITLITIAGRLTKVRSVQVDGDTIVITTEN